MKMWTVPAASLWKQLSTDIPQNNKAPSFEGAFSLFKGIAADKLSFSGANLLRTKASLV